MAKMNVRYLVCRKNANGTDRYYWQPDKILREAGWPMRSLPADRAAAITEAEEINRNVDEWRLGNIKDPVRGKPGTIDDVIEKYKKSRYYLELATSTRKDYDHYLRIISQWAGDVPAAAINAKMVQDLYEPLRLQKPRKAAYLIQVLRLLFSFAERESIIPKNSNPATKPGIDYRAEKGRLWQPDEVTRFAAAADDDEYFSIGTAVMLNEWLGQRRIDLLKIPMSAYQNGSIFLRQSKGHRNRDGSPEVVLPVDLVPHLKDRLERQIQLNKTRAGRIAGTALIQQLNGKTYTGDGFMSAFERIREKVTGEHPDMKGLIFKDLRHTAVTRLAEAGAEIPMIASVTGHTFKSCQEIIDRYNVRTTKMAREAFSRRIKSEGAN